MATRIDVEYLVKVLEGKGTSLRVDSALDNVVYYNNLTDETRVIVTTSVYPDHKDRADDVVYFGLTLGNNLDDIPTEVYEKLAKVTNELVERGFIELGTLCPPMLMKLIPKCTVCGGHYAVLTLTTVEEAHKDCIESSGTTPPPLQDRSMFLLYAVSRFTREELNEKMEGAWFITEGQFPPETSFPSGNLKELD